MQINSKFYFFSVLLFINIWHYKAKIALKSLNAKMFYSLMILHLGRTLLDHKSD
jgi:hypothetical protein